MLELLKPWNLCSATREATAMRAYTLQQKQPLLTASREKPRQQQRPSIAKHKEMNKIIKKIKKSKRDFPGGTVDKNPPANAGDMGLILVWEDSTCH